MFVALNKLKESINGAILFSNEIGKKNLSADYQLSSENDMLGKSLILMQQKLIDYENISTKNRLLAKQSIIRGEENERVRISRELHDGLGPLLTSLKLTVKSSELNHIEKGKIIETLDSTIAEIRRMTYDLMPPALADFGVGKALMNFVGSIKKSSGIDITYEYETKERGSSIDTEIDICLFRVCQELVNNTLKHANASKIVLSLTEFDNKYALYYADNGSGFNLEEVKTGLGLRNIRERVEVFEGYLDIKSGSKGTVVEVEIPIKE
jgi:signal transduction histidine kinase